MVKHQLLKFGHLSYMYEVDFIEQSYGPIP